MKRLENKTALITGASRGIGEAIALRFAEEGANIAFTYLSSEQKARDLESRLQGMGVNARGFRSDAGDSAAAEVLVQQVMKEWDGIDVCVNNAGISRDNLLLRMSPEQWDEVMQANLKSVYNLCRQVIRPMMKARKGSIINMSSIVGIRGNAGQSSYAASKAGIIGFTKSLAQEMGARNIRCNAIAPGFIQTDMTDYLQGEGADQWFEKIPMKRFGKPEEVAALALFLASDESAYISGQVVSICGAMNT